MRLKCLITGSCGFIFSNFIRKAIYNKIDMEIVSVDRVNDVSNLHNIYANKGHKFYIGDVTDTHFIDLIFNIEKPDLVIHGADTKDDNCVLNNILSTQRILDACLKYDVSRLFYISSDEVYGTLPLDSTQVWNEETTYNPLTRYAVSKASGELLLRTILESKLKCDILRLCNVFGPRQSTHNFLPSIIKKMLNNEPITLQGEGQRIREWLYVEDIYNAVTALLASEHSESVRATNISAGYEFSDLEICHEISKCLGYKEELITFDKQPLMYKKVSTQSSLTWRPAWKIKPAIAQTCQWYLNNKWYLK